MSSANVDSMRSSNNPEIKRLLGREGDFGQAIGISNDWAYNIIKLVGNYEEILRAQRRTEHAAQARARSERAVERRRHPLRAADPLGVSKRGTFRRMCPAFFGAARL